MSNILVAVEQRENRRLLLECLGQHYTVTVAASVESLDEPFDLGVFDGQALHRLWRHIDLRREAALPLFLPILLVTPRQDVSMITRQLWRVIDEVIATPIEKPELMARVETLLRARRFSLELEGKNILLKQEITAHEKAEHALRQSEERAKVLQQFTAMFATVLTEDDLSRLVSEKVVSVFDGHLSTIATLSEDGANLAIQGTDEVVEAFLDRNGHLSLYKPLPVADVIRLGKPLWINSLDEYIARYGHLEYLLPSSGTQASAILPLEDSKGSVIGALTLAFEEPRHFTQDEQAFCLSLALQCAQALERTQLYQQAQNVAVLEDRQRLARDLHDAVNQNLFAIYTIAQALPKLWQRQPEQVQGQLGQLTILAQATMAEMRTLLLELRPSNLIKYSLSDLFEQLINSAKARRKIAFSCEVQVKQPLPEGVHTAFFRITQEALNNIVKHSSATHGSISLTAGSESVILRIWDNGRGFQIDTVSGGLGLGMMQERAAIIGGDFRITSIDGQGTEIMVSCAISRV